MKRISYILLLSMLAFGMAACEDDESGDYDNSVTIAEALPLMAKPTPTQPLTWVHPWR